jgi:hypothetical protein
MFKLGDNGDVDGYLFTRWDTYAWQLTLEVNIDDQPDVWYSTELKYLS